MPDTPGDRRQADHDEGRRPPGLQQVSPDGDRRVEGLVVDALNPTRLGVNTASVHVSVRRGIVTLTGLAASAEARDVIDDAASTVPGVRAVQNRLGLGAA
ncbi:MAG TPA: BON domain-containing protein [Thermomicrobiaceae bacterium]|nr:BON domain-containing protein [Thermomicrobiaceae bacterium]